MHDTREQRIYIETDRHRIAGTIRLARDGYRSRVSDVLNATERDFIALTEVTIEMLGHDGPGTYHEMIALARRHIVLAIPELDADSRLRPAPPLRSTG